MFPDQSAISNQDWCSCCFEHDVSYWRGGTADQRERADLRLKQCVEEKTANSILAQTMFDGVRFGGSPYFYNWYRWGYGWNYERKYHALNQAEEQLADELFAQYMVDRPHDVCGQ